MVTPSIRNTLSLLEYLRESPSGANVQELRAVIDAPRSSFFVLLKALRALGYIEQYSARGPYFAGPKLLAWGNKAVLVDRELLRAFREQTHLAAPRSGHSPIAETLALALPRPQGMLIVEQTPSPHRLRVMYTVGEMIPPKECAAAALFGEFKLPANIQGRGYVLQEQADAVELALPICADGLKPTAAILLTAPRVRFASQDLLAYLPILRDMAARISHRLGAQFYAPFREQREIALQPQSGMTWQEISGFLDGLHVARLACLKPDGTPHVVPVWQQWDGAAIYVAAWEGSFWAAYLSQNPAVSLTVDEPWPPLRRVIVRGEARPLNKEDYPGGADGLAAALRRRYLGAVDVPLASRGWQAFRITPSTLRGWQGLPLAE